MAKRKNHVNPHHKSSSSKDNAHSYEKGYIGQGSSKMNKNEKIIMALLVLGIVIFLILSLIVLFRKTNENKVSNLPTSTIVPASKINTTPYPTIVPVVNMTVTLNGRMFNPDTFSLPKNGMVDFLNLDNQAITLVASDLNSQMLNVGPISPGDVVQVKFDKPGIYKYHNANNASESGEITIK